MARPSINPKHRVKIKQVVAGRSNSCVGPVWTLACSPRCGRINFLPIEGHGERNARTTDCGYDLGGSVVGRPKWNFADGARVHGKPVARRGMYTHPQSNRSGSKAVDRVTPGAVLRHCQVLPQRGPGVSCRHSARRDEDSYPQENRCRGCSSTGRREKRRACGFNRPNREDTKAGRKQAKRNFRG
jgi:hypothetical protein